MIECCLPVVEHGFPLCLCLVTAVGGFGPLVEGVVTPVRGLLPPVRGVGCARGGLSVMPVGLAIIADPAEPLQRCRHLGGEVVLGHGFTVHHDGRVAGSDRTVHWTARISRPTRR